MNGRTLIAWLQRNRLPTLAGAVLLLLLVLWIRGRSGADGSTSVVEVTRLVPVTVPAGLAPEVTRIVVVTATPAATPAAVSPDPATLDEAVIPGPVTLDPAQAVDAASATVIRNVLETLVYPDPQNPGAFLPLLATRWQIEENGQRYTFTLRRGISFSNGLALTVDDVAYSLQRLLLQSTIGGPQQLLIGPLLGYESGDVTAAIPDGPFGGNQAALLENTTERERAALCERVQQAIRADATTGTVTLELVRPWAPLLAVLSQPWAGIVSREWTTARGDWDGNCDNWTAWYAPEIGDTPLATAILGSGPYGLDHWTPGREYVLTANNNYWRSSTEPMWNGGPGGDASLKTIRVMEVPEENLRWRLLRDGRVATAPVAATTQILADQMVGEVCVPPGDACIAGPVPDGPLRHIAPLPHPDFLALVFNFGIATADNPYIGSGELDGNGIPSTFFADVHVRRAFAYCLDEEAYVTTALGGNGAATGSMLPAGWLPAGIYPYTYDSQLCAQELLQAFANQVATTGFRLQIPYLAGDSLQQAAAALLQDRFHALNPSYQIETVGLPEAAYRQAYESRVLPLAFVRWQPPLVDPHFYFAPLFDDAVAAYQRMPDILEEGLRAYLAGGLEATTPEARREQYTQLELLWQDQLPFLPLPLPASNRYEQRWLRGWFYQPEAAAPYYYAYWRQAEE